MILTFHACYDVSFVMQKVLVTFLDTRARAEITLQRGLLSCVEPRDAHRWGRGVQIRALDDHRLEVEGSGDRIGDLDQFLANLQNGLLYADVSGMRLSRPLGLLPVRPLTERAGRADLTGPDGRYAILAFWGDTIHSREAADFASAQDHVAFTLSPGPRKTYTRLSVLVPPGQAEAALSDLTTLKIMRARPALLTYEPEALARFGEPGPVSEWGPVGERMTRDLPRTPPLLGIDAMTLNACEESAAANEDPVLFWPRLIKLLSECWRLGAEASGSERAKGVPPRILVENFRELAHAIEMATRDDRRALDFTRVRAVARICGLEAWRYGFFAPAALRRARVPSRYREEAAIEMRPVHPPARDLLIALCQGETDLPYEASAYKALIDGGFLDPLRVPTREGQIAVRAQIARGRRRLPSVMEVPRRGVALYPRGEEPHAKASTRPKSPARKKAGRKSARTGSVASPPRAWKADPEKVAAGTEALLRELTRLHETPERVRPEGDRDPYEEGVLELLLRGWGVGRSSEKRPPKELTLFLKERSRVIAEQTRPRRAEADLRAASELTRASVLEAVRIGSGENPGLQPRFREECTPALRPVRAGERPALLALFQEEFERTYPKGLLGRLERVGLIQSGRSLLLTEAGIAAVRAEIAHMSSAPSILTIVGLEPLPAAQARTLPPQEFWDAEREEEEERERVRRRTLKAPRIDHVRIPDEAVREIEASALKASAAALVGRGRTHQIRPPLTRILLSCWQSGYAHNPVSVKAGKKPPKRVAFFVAERARVISEATAESRKAGDASAVSALLIPSGMEIWRIGMIMAEKPNLPLPPRFREECAVEMRAVPDEARSTLIRLLQNTPPRRYPSRDITSLERGGFVTRSPRPELTETGRAAALAATDGPDEELPSITQRLSEP